MPTRPAAAGGSTWGCAGIFKPDFERAMKFLKNNFPKTAAAQSAHTFAKFSKFRKHTRCLQTTGLLLLLLWAACKKGELPPPAFGDPVFMLSFTSGPDTSITAGVGGVYLFTGYSADGPAVFSTGTFAKENCPGGDCPGSLRFQFNSTGQPFSPDSAFQTGSYGFVGSDSLGATIYLTTFSVLNNNGYNNFSWRINDINAGQGAPFIKEFTDNLPKMVELTARRPSGLKSTVQRTVSLTNPGSTYPAVGLFVQKIGTQYQLTAETSGVPVSQYAWIPPDSSNTEILVTSSLLGKYSVTVTDTANAVTAFAQLDSLQPSDVPLRTAGFSYTVEPIVIPGQLGRVTIQWIDAQGLAWRSDEGSQPSAAFFQVLESGAYELNEKGQKTRKMRVSFSCRLFNNAGENLEITGAGVIAVGHP